MNKEFLDVISLLSLTLCMTLTGCCGNQNEDLRKKQKTIKPMLKLATLT